MLIYANKVTLMGLLTRRTKGELRTRLLYQPKLQEREEIGDGL